MSVKEKIQDADFKKGSVVLLIVAALVFIVWDLLPFISKKIGDTLSELIQLGMYKNPALIFGFGMLIGHWLFRNETMKMNSFVTFTVMGIVFLAIGVGVVVQYTRPFILPTCSVLLLFASGFIAGHFLWPLDAIKGYK